MPEIVPKLYTQPSGVAVLFYWNLSIDPFLGQVVNLDQLHRHEYDLCLRREKGFGIEKICQYS